MAHDRRKNLRFFVNLNKAVVAGGHLGNGRSDVLVVQMFFVRFYVTHGASRMSYIHNIYICCVYMLCSYKQDSVICQRLIPNVLYWFWKRGIHLKKKEKWWLKTKHCGNGFWRSLREHVFELMFLSFEMT